MDLQIEVKIHKLLAGPYSLSDVDPEFDPDNDEDAHWIEAMVEIDGQLKDMTISHKNFDKIYNIIKHLSSPTVEPYILGREYE